MDRDIERILSTIDGRGYKAYKRLKDAKAIIGDITIRVVHVQGDPFAPPSIVLVEKPLRKSHIIRKYPIPSADYALRRAYIISKKLSLKNVGEGHSGIIRVPRPGPVIIRRAASEIIETNGGLILRLRLWVGLPSRRRRILGNIAREILLKRLPELVEATVKALEERELMEYVNAWREQEYIRQLLPKLHAISFIADGSILPRACGGCDEPLENAVPFRSPPSLRREIELPTGRSVSGMLLREGITLIVGPAFHGKTTLLEAIASGVWNHIPGDGRELVVTRRDAFWIQSENGRWVSCVDVSPWIESMPGLRDPHCWSTSNASGATSAIASLQEAIEAGSRLILIDEDSTATNFIHRDAWTEEITGKRTLLSISDMARVLKESGISIVIVASGSLPLLANADTVILMDEYIVRDATEHVNKVKRAVKSLGIKTSKGRYHYPRKRILKSPFNLVKPKLRGRLLEGRNLRDRIDLSPLRQLAEDSQLSSIIYYSIKLLSNTGEIVSRALEIERSITKYGDWKRIQKTPSPSSAEVRWLDILFVINRIPGLSITTNPPPTFL